MINEALTVGQYQDLYAVVHSEMDEVDKNKGVVAAVTGKTYEEIEELSHTEFKLLARKAVEKAENLGTKRGISDYLKLGGKTYRVCLQPYKLPIGALQTIMRYLNDEPTLVSNLHALFAWIVEPVIDYKVFKIRRRWKKDEMARVASLIKQVEYDELLNIVKLFIKIWNSSLQLIKQSLINEVLAKTDFSPDEAKGYAESAIALVQIPEI